ATITGRDSVTSASARRVGRLIGPSRFPQFQPPHPGRWGHPPLTRTGAPAANLAWLPNTRAPSAGKLSHISPSKLLKELVIALFLRIDEHRRQQPARADFIHCSPLAANGNLVLSTANRLSDVKGHRLGEAIENVRLAGLRVA